MPLTTKLAALIEALRGTDFNTMRPADRRQLAAICRFIAARAEPKPEEPKAGVLYDLQTRRRDE